MRRLPIADPCSQPWDEMRAEGSRRWCESCNLHVHDLSALSPAAAEGLVERHRGALCVRYLHDGDEILHFAPAPRPAGRSMEAAAALLAAAWIASCTPHSAPVADAFEVDEPSPMVRAVTLPAAPRRAADPLPPTGDEPCEPPSAEPDPRPRMGKPIVRPEEVVGLGM
jgi:hypothetical protein